MNTSDQPDPIARNLSRLDAATASYNNGALTPQKPATSGFYQGYGDGNHQVVLPDGGVLYGRFDSNSLVQNGDRVSVQQARGATPRFKVIPR